MKNEFDDKLLKKFEEHEFPFDEHKWETLSHLLPKQKSNRKVLWLTSIGVAASLLVGALLLYKIVLHSHNNTELAQTPTIKHQQTQQNNHQFNNIPHNNTPIQQPQPATNIALASKNNKFFHKHIALASNNTVANNPINQPIVPQSIANTTTAIPNTPTQTAEPSTNNAAPTTGTVANATPTKQPVLVSEAEIGFNPLPNKTSNNNKPNLSLAGGLNYGSLNTGYTAGLNAHQKIGRKLFIESDLAVTNNHSNNVSVISASQFSAFSNGTGASKPVTNAVQQSTASFLYLQFNPSVGYNIHPKIALSFGADLQKLLNNNSDNRTVIFNADDPKQLPNLDVGLTGKTEVSVTPRLKAGVLYREGLNNFINGSNEYFDRRYLQVQLKFRVLGK